MNVLITGGCGFIGSHIAEKLLSKEHKVTIIDNLSTGRLENIDHLVGDNLNVVIEDISNYDKIEKYFKSIDIVYHIAALADIVPSIENPMQYHNSNVNGTLSVLECSRKYKIKRFIYAASSSCYGIPKDYPTNELAEIRPQYPYATTKYLGEQYVMNWNTVYGLSVTSLRFFNVYGTRSRTSGTYGAVFGVFLAQKLNDKPFTVVGDGSQTRDFTYVLDLVQGLVKSAFYKEAVGKAFNLASGKEIKIKDMIELVNKSTNNQTPITKFPSRKWDTKKRLLASIDLAKELIDYKPIINFKDGLKENMKWFNYNWNKIKSTADFPLGMSSAVRKK